MVKKFYENFSVKDKKLLNGYFKELNSSIKLTKRETKLFNEDFENAIMYYYKKNIPVNEILSILNILKMGDIYKEENVNWYPLDNAAKIYPLSMKENWMSVFRLSYYLKENIVPEIFQIALTFTMKRFPTFRTSIRKGFFWNYIDGIKKRFHVYEDKMLPCSYINVSSIGKQSFKAVYYKNRISVEYFHILTDGYGGVVFLSTLVNTYLELLGKKVNYNDLVLDINEEPYLYEIKDEFIKKKDTNKTRSLVDSSALQIDGKLSNIRPCQILHFDLNLNEVKKVCKDKNVTITELLLAFIFISSSYMTSKSGYIKVQVPVNMRKFYDSKTLRNFSLYAVISINKKDIKEIDSVLKIIHKQMEEKTTKEVLNETMSYTNKLVNSIRIIPLFIKKPIASLVYGYLGDRVLTSVLSNLGNIDIPSEMKEYVEKMDFSLGTGITNRALFSCVTCNNILTFTISKSTINSGIENAIYNLMKENGLCPKVYGSDIYENSK